MTIPPTFHLRDLGSHAQLLSKNCGNQRMAMVLHSVAVGSMIIMAGVAASRALQEAFGPTDQQQDRDRSR